jgi:hypothetical protein
LFHRIIPTRVTDHPTHLIHFNGERFLGPLLEDGRFASLGASFRCQYCITRVAGETQLADAPDDLRVTVSFASARETTSLLLREAHDYPQRLLSPSDPRREPRSFELALTPLGTKGGKGQGSVVRDTRRQVIDSTARSFKT